MPNYRIDKAFSPTKVQKTDEGFLFVTAPIARSGIYEYRRADGSIQREWVPEETLFEQESLDSLQMKPVTNNHPTTFVTAQDAFYKSVGSVGQKFLRDGQLLYTDFTVMDSVAIKAIENGKEQLSPGYSCDVEMVSGVTPDGEKYDAIQRNRRYNHLALVNKARGGDQITLRADCAMEVCGNNMDDVEHNKGGSMPKIKLDSVEYEIDSNVATHISNLSTEKQDAIDALATEKAEAVKAQAKIDSLEADLAKAKADAMDEEAFNKRVDARVELLATAREICGDEIKNDATDLELQKAVIVKMQPKANFDGIDEKDLATYVQARFDMAVESAKDKAIGDQRKMQGDNSQKHNDEKETIQEHLEARWKA